MNFFHDGEDFLLGRKVLTEELDAADSGVGWESQVQRERVASLPLAEKWLAVVGMAYLL